MNIHEHSCRRFILWNNECVPLRLALDYKDYNNAQEITGLTADEYLSTAFRKTLALKIHVWMTTCSWECNAFRVCGMSFSKLPIHRSHSQSHRWQCWRWAKSYDAVSDSPSRIWMNDCHSHPETKWCKHSPKQWDGHSQLMIGEGCSSWKLRFKDQNRSQ